MTETSTSLPASNQSRRLRVVLTAWYEVGGIGRYAHELARELDTHVDLVVAGLWKRDFGPKPVHTKFVGVPFFRPARWHQRLICFRVRNAVGSAAPDVVHLLDRSVDGLLNNLWPETPRVGTIHDLLYEQFPGSGDHLVARPDFRSIPHTCAHLIAISQATLRDLERIHQVQRDKVTVIHQGCRLMTIDRAPPIGLAPPKRGLVFVGQREGYKNFSGVMQALAQWPADRVRPTLIVVGRPFAHHETAEIQRLQLTPFIQHRGRLPDATLAKVYRDSLALIYPSKHEGFGLPVLEAMACDTAVITSNTSSLPEVAGTAALLVNPTDPTAIRTAIARVIDEPSLREGLVAKGRARAARFRWADTAAATRQVYEHVASNGRISCRDHIVGL